MHDFTKIQFLSCLAMIALIFFACVTPVHILGWISRTGMILGAFIAIFMLVAAITEGDE